MKTYFSFLFVSWTLGCVFHSLWIVRFHGVHTEVVGSYCSSTRAPSHARGWRFGGTGAESRFGRKMDSSETKLQRDRENLFLAQVLAHEKLARRYEAIWTEAKNLGMLSQCVGMWGVVLGIWAAAVQSFLSTREWLTRSLTVNSWFVSCVFLGCPSTPSSCTRSTEIVPTAPDPLPEFCQRATWRVATCPCPATGGKEGFGWQEK